MKKKIYTKDLSLEEILDRLDRGEKIVSGHSDKIWFKKEGCFLVKYLDGKPAEISTDVPIIYEAYFEAENKAEKSFIGKLCRFWNSEEKDSIIGLLQSIEPPGFKIPYRQDGGGWYAHCRPLTAEEVKQYIKE